MLSGVFAVFIRMLPCPLLEGFEALGFGSSRLFGERGVELGRPLGYFIFSLIGLKRTLLTNIFQRL